MRFAPKVAWCALFSAVLATAGPALAQNPFGDLLTRAEDAAQAVELGAPVTSRPLLHGLDRFFERLPLGFDGHSLLGLEKRLERAVVDAGDGLSAWWAQPVEQRLGVLGALLAGLLLAALLWWLDRRLRRAVTSATERLHLGGRKHLRDVAVALLRTLGAVVLPAVALVLSYVPLQDLASGAGWPRVASALLLLWLIWRGLTVLTRQLLNPLVIEMTERHARLVRRTVLWAVRAFVGFRGARVVMAALGADVPELAVLDFGMRLALTAVTARLLFIKSAVMDFFPEAGPGLYTRFRTLLDRFYYPLTVATTALVLMWSFGYERASLGILWRLYAALALVVVGSLVLRHVVVWLEREREKKDEQSRRLASRLLDDASGYLRFFLVLLLVITALAVLGLWRPVLGVLGYPLFRLGALELSLLSFAKAALVFVVFLLVSRLVRTLLDVRVYARLELDEGLAYAASATVHYALLVFGIFAALLSTGLDLTVLGVFFGALGIGIGLGLQELVRDTVAGFVLLFGRAVKKGDLIAAPNGTMGEVQRVGVRSVTIKTRDFHELVVPTSHVVNGTIVNYSHTSPLIRAHVAVGTSYNAEPKAVREALLAAAEAFPEVARHPRPRVWLVGFGDSAVNYELLVWINVKKMSEAAMRGELYFVIWDQLKAAGIEIPFPQRDLHIKSIEAELLVARREEAA
jgi:small-conductance mechanosensitive channel